MIPAIEDWNSDTSKELVDKIFGELMRAKPEVAKEFIRLMLRWQSTCRKKHHNAFVEFCNRRNRSFGIFRRKHPRRLKK